MDSWAARARRLAAVVAVATGACAREPMVGAPVDVKEPEHPEAAAPPNVQVGKASYYAKRFRGRKTANGERLRPDAAHGGASHPPLRHVGGGSPHRRAIGRGPHQRPRPLRRTGASSTSRARRRMQLGILHDGMVEVELRPIPSSPFRRRARTTSHASPVSRCQPARDWRSRARKSARWRRSHGWWFCWTGALCPSRRRVQSGPASASTWGSTKGTRTVAAREGSRGRQGREPGRQGISHFEIEALSVYVSGFARTRAALAASGPSRSHAPRAAARAAARDAPTRRAPARSRARDSVRDGNRLRASRDRRTGVGRHVVGPFRIVLPGPRFGASSENQRSRSRSTAEIGVLLMIRLAEVCCRKTVQSPVFTPLSRTTSATRPVQSTGPRPGVRMSVVRW